MSYSLDSHLAKAQLAIGLVDPIIWSRERMSDS